MTESEFPEVPETADQMVARWAERDAAYAKLRTPMAPDAVAAIRTGRMREASLLPVADRARMWAKVQTWQPPVHPDFGSMKDWLN
jgi:hypothetical protein